MKETIIADIKNKEIDVSVDDDKDFTIEMYNDFHVIIPMHQALKLADFIYNAIQERS
jgi:hypothetical protein